MKVFLLWIQLLFLPLDPVFLGKNLVGDSFRQVVLDLVNLFFQRGQVHRFRTIGKPGTAFRTELASGWTDGSTTRASEFKFASTLNTKLRILRIFLTTVVTDHMKSSCSYYSKLVLFLHHIRQNISIDTFHSDLFSFRAFYFVICQCPGLMADFYSVGVTDGFQSRCDIHLSPDHSIG